MDNDYSIHVRVFISVFSLDSDYSIHIRVYVHCLLWIVTVVYMSR